MAKFLDQIDNAAAAMAAERSARSLEGTYRKKGNPNRLEVEAAGTNAFIWHIVTRRGDAVAAGSIDRAGLAKMLEQGWAK